MNYDTGVLRMVFTDVRQVLLIVPKCMRIEPGPKWDCPVLEGRKSGPVVERRE